ncbi:MAG: CAP domain-containing protein [Methanomicrobiales archaeon]|nr:CAP domain-containing protein [Methanomicrobiales archaeon]
MGRHWHHRKDGAGYSSHRRRRGGGILAPLLVLTLCVLGVFLLTHPDVLRRSGGTILPLPALQPQATPTPPVYDEIHARYGDKYQGYESLIKRTPSGGFETRDADAALAGQTTTAPVQTQKTIVTTTTNATAPSASKIQQIESFIFQYTNEERRMNGVPALKMNTCLNEIARAHSEDMAAKEYFSHGNLQGQDPSVRASIHGCPTRKSLDGGMIQVGIAENIGKMPTGNVMGLGYVSDIPQSVARAQVDSWMGSSGHRGNILNPVYSSIGIGIARDASGYYISTQDFW